MRCDRTLLDDMESQSPPNEFDEGDGPCNSKLVRILHSAKRCASFFDRRSELTLRSSMFLYRT